MQHINASSAIDDAFINLASYEINRFQFGQEESGSILVLLPGMVSAVNVLVDFHHIVLTFAIFNFNSLRNLYA